MCPWFASYEGYTASALVELTVGNIVWYMLEGYIAYTEGSNEGVDVSACDREDMEKWHLCWIFRAGLSIPAGSSRGTLQWKGSSIRKKQHMQRTSHNLASLDDCKEQIGWRECLIILQGKEYKLSHVGLLNN